MIVKVLNKISNGLYEFETKYGNFNGVWCDSKLPILKKNYSVELDSERVFTTNDISQSNSYTFEITHNQLLGILEEYDGEIITVRIGESLIELFTDSSTLFNEYIGKYIRISGIQFMVYDDGLL